MNRSSFLRNLSTASFQTRQIISFSWSSAMALHLLNAMTLHAEQNPLTKETRWSSERGACSLAVKGATTRNCCLKWNSFFLLNTDMIHTFFRGQWVLWKLLLEWLSSWWGQISWNKENAVVIHYSQHRAAWRPCQQRRGTRRVSRLKALASKYSCEVQRFCQTPTACLDQNYRKDLGCLWSSSREKASASSSNLHVCFSKKSRFVHCNLAVCWDNLFLILTSLLRHAQAQDEAPWQS